VQCCLPENLEKVEKITLGKALNYWLHFLRTGDRKAPAESEFSPTFHKSVLGEISIRGLSSMHGLIDSGFGYSQLLPILVRGLVARGNGTLLVEQPELHLHPSVQIRLADFFAGLCRAGRQVIVETHSEHLVNAFRVLVAESKEGSDLHDVIKIHYIGANEGQRPHCYDLSVQPDGTVPAWPREFFGEALALSSRLLKAQKRRRTTNIIPSNGGGE
jgi:predicted ATPase